MQLEKSIDDEILINLKKIGHEVKFSKNTHGGGQGIFINRKEGILIGGSDSRKDGCALGF